MKPREALVLALRDFYANSWRLVALNAALGVVLVASILAALALPVAGVLLAAAGPAAAVIVHCSVTLVRTGDLAFADAWEGLRLHWRRGLVLSVLGCALIGLGAVALRFYGASAIWPLAFLTLYVLVLLGIYGLVLWTVAIAEPDRGLRELRGRRPRLVACGPGRRSCSGSRWFSSTSPASPPRSCPS